MEWIVIISSSTVVVAAITAIITLIKTNIDNKAKTNDAIKSFRYTRLHEIVESSYENELPLGVSSGVPGHDVVNSVFGRLDSLDRCYALAKPLVDEVFWGNMDELFQRALEARGKLIEKVELVGTVDGMKLLNKLLVELNSANKRFDSSIEAQMRALLK